jgi:DNA-binding XRE family transcriptional regulator
MSKREKMIDLEQRKGLALLEQAAVNIMEIVKNIRQLELLPMSEIMAKVPGATVVEKAAEIGVSRQTCYYWLQGRSRPSLEQAERIAELTGISVHDIRGT